MKYILNAFTFLAMLTVAIMGCNKFDDVKSLEALPLYVTGVSPTLSSSTTTVAPTLAEADNKVIKFSWTDPKYANVAGTSKYILEFDTANANFLNATSITSTAVLDTNLTARQINNILIGFGYPLGQPKTLYTRLVSSYANNNDRYASNVLSITTTPFDDPSVLTSTEDSVTLSLTNAGINILDLSWTAPFQGYNGGSTYVIQYDSAGKGFASPQTISLSPNTAILRGLTQGELNAAALSEGVIGGTLGSVDFRICATTASGVTTYSNIVTVDVNTYFPTIRMYLPGGYQSATGNGNDWDPATAPELIRDVRSSVLNDMYYIYIWLPSGAFFKVSEGRSWNTSYGSNAGSPTDITSNNGDNFTVAQDGFYRITVNRTTLKYDIREGRMGFVGGAIGANWNPPSVFPTYAMANAATNLFIGVTEFTADGWKLIDNDQWNNGSNAVDETRSYGSNSPSGGTLEVNGSNFPNISTAGSYRVIWDGRDRDNIKYEMMPSTEMRLVGDGINQAGVVDWNPASSPQMTYLGNGKWTITIALKANKDIKFLAGNDWGAFDYEDNSGGTRDLGVNRSIKWEGGDNFKTPVADGTYTIVLDENKQIVTIN